VNEHKRLGTDQHEKSQTSPEQESIQELFIRTAETYRSDVAIAYGNRRITYGELNDRTNLLAHSLLQSEERPGTIIAILVENPLDLTTAIIGALKARCAFVPLDPGIPEERLKVMLATVCPGKLITDATFIPIINRLNGDAVSRVIRVDDEEWSDNNRGDQEQISEGACRRANPPLSYEPDDLCYVYFTSGSTGIPKGIAGRLKGIAHFIRWEINTLGIRPGVRVSRLLSPSFDGSLRDLFVPLCSGGVMCIPDNQKRVFDAGRLIDWIERMQINIIHCVPSQFRSILIQDLSPKNFASLKYILMAGEPLTASDVGRWMSIFGERIQLVNLYGTSETTMAKFAYFVKSDDQDRRSIPIGKPIAGARALLLDEQRNPCPPGVVGEIYIRTPYRSLGYYGRPDLTKEVFIRNPFSRDPDDLIYKTGDLGRLLNDGNYEFIGRADQQVKIRGMRVELDEVEQLLRNHQMITEAAVIDQDDTDGIKFLSAYLTVNHPVEPAELRNYLAALLPDYMVPSAFIILDTLPRTISGKIDRRALPALGKDRTGHETKFVPPRNQIEEILIGIYSQVLGINGIGVNDNFFHLGGHSLRALQVLSRIQSAFEINLPVEEIFETPTIAGLAKRIESVVTKDNSVPPIIPISRDSPMPLSFAQQRLWFLHLMNPASSAYHIPLVLSMNGRLNLPVLEAVIGEIVGRHESLRTVFAMIDGEPVQVISPFLRLTLPLLDLSELSEETAEATIQRYSTEEIHRPFDLSQGQLLRVAILRQTADRSTVFFMMHHIVGDGWSMGVLAEEITELYQAYVDGTPSPLPQLPVQYADYAVWQRQWLRGETLDRRSAFWKGRLGGGLPLLQLPIDRPRPALFSYRGAAIPFEISADVTESIKHICRLENVTLYMFLLAVCNVILHRYTDQDDIVVGTPVANRNRPEIEGLIGFFVNTLAMRVKLSGRSNFRQVLKAVRQTAIDAFANQDLPFEKLVEELQPERNLSHSPIFQVLLVLQNAPVEDVRLPGVVMSAKGFQQNTAKFDLTFQFVEINRHLIGSLEYNTDIFADTTIERIVRHYRQLSEAAVENPDRPISELPILTRTEQKQLLSEWNETTVAYPHNLCIHRLFERQAKSAPDKTALSFGEQEMTYQELNRRANHYAYYLSALDVGPEIKVGIFLERSIELVIGLLAVLKAGGAYVPIDPRYPQERVSFILRDAEVKIILTQESLINSLPPVGARTILMDALTNPEERQNDQNPETGVSSDNIAYVIYTSGSTGVPKGVSIEHRSATALIHWAGAQFSAHELSGVLASTSVCFDLSIFELFVPLGLGGHVMLVDNVLLASDLLLQGKVTLINTVPSAITELMRMNAIPQSVTTVNLAGEALHRGVVDQLYNCSCVKRVLNLYGPTEDTTYSTLEEVLEAATEPPTIGRPIANSRAHVLDRGLEATVLGVQGELYLAGDGLARGYLNRADTTAERFLPDRFANSAGSRIYRTGDIVKYRTDGRLDYLGRIDSQVKVRGYRIELGEVDSRVRDYSKIRDCVTIVSDRTHGSRELICYFVGEAGENIEIEDLKKFLREKLPEFMIPAVFIKLDALPLSSNGKVDRKSLPSPDGMRPNLKTEYSAPRDNMEQRLAEIWAEALGLESVGVHDNFFDLGGHSLLIARVHHKLQTIFEAKITITEMFKYPTIRSLSDFLRGKEESDLDLQDSRHRAEIRRKSIGYRGKAEKPFFHHEETVEQRDREF